MKKWNLAFAVMAISALSGCGDAPPKTLEEINRHISSVSTTQLDGVSALVFSLDSKMGYDGASFFFMASDEANRILPKLIKYFPEQNPDVVAFTLNGKLVDKYGNEKDSPVIQLAFKMDEVKKVNYETGQFTNWDLLELMDNIEFLNPAGASIVREYCTDDSNAKHAARFCSGII
ncbi:hypothetical protein [Pseudomonas anguilliseptica]|jgi:hypothetical protein|uniref:Lipoprotein n=1 Tax=Pseudomonas anguilliseptica TaxID=53406 RepID=A0A1H5DMH6_PSEAG|nr:hypothetical protein [Pseudomonas anguilliseptica]SED80069.1 hypothetical protein SAMN05421553_3364 [Pseudomonas anguilliseptica]